jgi:error-prone DNA polymerase
MIGLDTAKSVFQIHGVNETGKAELKRKVRRSELIAFFEKQESCTVVMEACGGAHHWARILSGLGHTVKLLVPEAVKPFVKKGKKNDAADAAAICEAAARPNAQFVPAKTVEQQGILALHADAAMPEQARQAIAELHQRCGELAKGIQSCEAEIVKHARNDPTARRLATIPGIGPITASLIAATVVDISLFKTARQFAAWLGLVPRQNSTGGKIRKLLVLGATSMVGRAEGWHSAVGGWLRNILQRRPARLVTVALANKMARIAWAVMTRNEVYRPQGGVAAKA